MFGSSSAIRTFLVTVPSCSRLGFTFLIESIHLIRNLGQTRQQALQFRGFGTAYLTFRRPPVVWIVVCPAWDWLYFVWPSDRRLRWYRRGGNCLAAAGRRGFQARPGSPWIRPLGKASADTSPELVGLPLASQALNDVAGFVEDCREFCRTACLFDHSGQIVRRRSQIRHERMAGEWPMSAKPRTAAR